MMEVFTCYILYYIHAYTHTHTQLYSFIRSYRTGKDYWLNLKPSSGRPESASLSTPATKESTE